jgi:hypothetical protein
MPGSPAPAGARNNAPVRVAFRLFNSVSAQNVNFVAQWLAYALPYRRFADALADTPAHGSGPMRFARPSS